MIAEGRESEQDDVGLCARCRHVRVVGSDRGSVFYQCTRAASDPRFVPYPVLPVRRCPGYECEEVADPR